MNDVKQIETLLPKYDCGSCGYGSCFLLAEAVIYKGESVNSCPLLKQERFKVNRDKLNKLTATTSIQTKETKKCKHCANSSTNGIKGVIDSYEADIILAPLEGEHSCREILMPVTSSIEVNKGNIIEYRPMGCPVVHHAKVLKKEGMLLTVHIVGHCDRDNRESATHKALGICMVVGFEGKYRGNNVYVGQTVRFLPDHCMMQKIHSGVVVNIEDDNILLEGIDLKVWAPPIITTL